TSSDEERDVIKGYSLGANSYVRKPVDLVEFTEAAKQLGLLLLLVAEAQLEARVVMGHHIKQRRAAAVVIEPPLLMCPEPRQRRGAVAAASDRLPGGVTASCSKLRLTENPHVATRHP